MLGKLCALIENLARQLWGKQGERHKTSSPGDFIPWVLAEKEYLEELEIKNRTDDDLKKGVLAEFGIF
jgi:hypothetical protein